MQPASAIPPYSKDLLEPSTYGASTVPVTGLARGPARPSVAPALRTFVSSRS
jgi:hypothetical protein